MTKKTSKALEFLNRARCPKRVSLRLLLFGFFWAAYSLQAAFTQDAVEKSSDRTAYRYMVEDVQVTITREDGKRWVGRRSDGRAIEYEETSVTEEYVELRSVQTKNLMRLGRERIHLSKDDGKTWQPWFKGAWIEPPPAADERDTTAGSLPDPDEAPPPPVGASANRADKPDQLIRLAYFVPRDRTPVRDYESRIRAVMSVVADVYRLEMDYRKQKKCGLSFESRGGKPVVHLVRGTEPARHYNNAPAYSTQEQWRRVLPEVARSVGDPKDRLIVVFNETFEAAPEKSSWVGTIALGARYSSMGGVGMFSATILQDGFCATNVREQYGLMFDQTAVPGQILKNEPRARSVRGEFVENGIGAVAHELGHALGLPHDHRDDWNDIMGNGFRKLRLNFTRNGPAQRVVGFSDENARLLLSSRYVSPDLDWADNKPPAVELELDARRHPPRLAVKASDDNGLRSIAYFDRIRRSIVGGSALEGKHLSLDFPLPLSTVHEGRCDIEAFVTDNGGNLTRTRKNLELASERRER